jgi:glycosyltransferase involved in cell wall biosynthesis
MKISVITVCLNSGKTIEQTIQSVINQKNCNYEYIIIDGKSTDDTLEIIKKYRDRISVVVSEPDSGIYDAMNKGISLATGDVVGIINSDDWFEPGAFARVEKYFRDTDAEVVYGKMNAIDLEGNVQILIPSNIEKIRYEMETPHPTVFVKREIYKKYGVFQLKYKIAADYELMLRLYTKGVKFKHLEYILANFRMGGISALQSETCAKETVEIASQYLPYAPLDKRQYFKDIIFHRKKAYLFDKLLNGSSTAFCDILYKELGVNDEDDIIIFGSGNWGKKIHRILSYNKKCILFFVDNDKTKWGGKVEQTKIVNPEILKSFKGVLLIAVEKFSEEISLQVSEWDNPYLYCICWEEISERILCIDNNLSRLPLERK